MDSSDYEVNYYHYARDHSGKLVPVGEVRRNQRTVPHFVSTITEPTIDEDSEDSPDHHELVEEITRGLTPVERHTLLRLASGRTIQGIAEEDGVARQAVYCRIAAMARKNTYCAIAAVYGVLRKKTNQHA